MSALARRRWLGAAGVLGAIAGFAQLPRLLVSHSPEDEALALQIARCTNGPGALVTLGRRYLGTHPDKGRIVALVGAIFPSQEQRDAARRMSRDELRHALARRISRDFHEGQLENAGGWLLSATEAHVVAIAALVAEG